MSILRNWIINNGYANVDPLEVQQILSQQVEIKRDDNRWTITGIGSLIGREALIYLVAGLESTPETKPMVYVLTSGVYLTDNDTRETIMGLQMAGLLSEENATKLLNQGILYGETWQKSGMNALPTIEEIQAVQATIATEILREQVAQRYQSVRDAIDAGEILTWEAARMALGAEWVDPVEPIA
jgi:hypothetical protein